MKTIYTFIFVLLRSHLWAQTYHQVASFSYSSELLTAGSIKPHPQNSKIIYAAAQNVNSSYKGFFDTYEVDNSGNITRTKRLGAGTDSFGVSDFVFKGNEVYAIGSKGLKIISITNPTSPQVTKSITTFMDGTTPKNIGYFSASLLSDGSRLHVGGFNYYLIDMSNLNNPVKLGERSYLGINSASIQKLGANKVIVGDGYDAIIMDVTNPQSIVKTTLSSLSGSPEGLLYDESKNVLYSANETTTQNFVYSINMGNLSKLDSFNYRSVSGFNPSSHGNMWLLKDTLYVGTSLGIAVFNVSNPSQLNFLGRLSTGGSNAVLVTEDFLVTNDNYSLKFYKRGPAPTTSISEIIYKPFDIYPNPANDKINFRLTNSETANITLFDYSGKNILENTISPENGYQININEIPSGIYLLKTTIKGKTYTDKIIIQ